MALKKNLFYNLILSISQILFPLVSIPYISRMLDADGIGKVNTIDSLTYFIIVIAELGFATYAVREISKLQNNKSELLQRTNQLISLHIVSTIVVSIIYAIGLYFLWLKIQSSTMLWFSALFFVSNIFNCEWYYWGTEKFKYIAIRSIITRLVGLVFIFLLIKSPSDFEKYYAIIVCTMMANIMLNAAQILPNFKPSFSAIKTDFIGCLPSYLIGILFSVINTLDNVLLGFTSSFVAVAYYANAVKVVRIGGTILTDTFIVFFSRATNLIAENKTQDIRILQQNTVELIWLLGIPLSVGLAIFSYPFTIIYFGLSLKLVSNNLLILSIYPILKSFSLFFNKQILMPNHLDKKVLIGYFFESIFFVIACLVLSNFYQDIGCSVALILSELFIVFYFYYQSKDFLEITKFYLLKSIVLFVFTIIIFGSIKLLFEYLFNVDLLTLLLEIFVAMGFYIVIVYYFFKYSILKLILKRKEKLLVS